MGAELGEYSPILSALRVWAAMAWADGVMAPEEAVAMTKLLDGANLTDDERATAKTWISTPVDLDMEKLSAMSTAAREGIYRAAVRLATVDKHFSAQEQAFLDRLREGLSIEVAEANAVAEAIAETLANPSPEAEG